MLALMRGERRGPAAVAARGGLWLLSLVYSAVIGAYWLLYRTGVLRRVRLRPVVVSVGNITVGGTGKTTTIQYVARLLESAGRRTAVLSYGYHGGSRDAVGVVSDGKAVLLDASEAGDEAVLLARSLPGVPVLIGRRRVLAGAEAEQRFHPDVLLCDDAFQYWRLHRDVDLVLVDAVEPWGYGYLLPRGLLREPKRRLRRASAFLITHSDLAAPAKLACLKREIEAFGRPVWTARHAPRAILDLEGAEAAPLGALLDRKVLAVSSLGDPASFEETLARAGAVVAPGRFADHHIYNQGDVQRMEERARNEGLQLVTTPKDAVKLGGLATAEMWWVLDIALAVDEAGSFEEWVRTSTGK